jgi:hypothetical protein
MEKEIIVALIGLASATLVPFVSSLLQRRNFDERSGEAGLLERRVRLIERLLANGKHLPEADHAKLEAELTHIVQQVVERHSIERESAEPKLESLSKWRRLLLAYEQPNLKASIYRGGFWVFTAIGLLGGTATISSNNVANDTFYAVLGGLLYVAIGSVLRSAAVRQSRRSHAGLGTTRATS